MKNNRSHAPIVLLLVTVGLSCTQDRGAVEPRAGRSSTKEEMEAGRFTLRGGRLEAMVMAPDQPRSAYRGPRYESGGIVLQVILDGRHTFLGEKRPGEQFDSFGLIEEMGISGAVGYEQAAVGGAFLKLGVGLLQRDADPQYLFYKEYPLAEPFGWSVTIGDLEASFVQVGKPFRGFAYRYEKRVTVDSRQPILKIAHSFANTGQKPISADQYCHNFFRFDDASPGPEYVVTTDFVPVAGSEALAFRIQGHKITLRDTPQGGVYCKLKGHNPGASNNSLRVRNERNGLEAQVEGDFPLAYLACYADPKSICPEPFYAINVKPGETVRWTRTYKFGGPLP